VDELPPGYFFCEKARCTLSVNACLGRQTANERRKGFEPIPFGICLQCPQGLENRLRFEKSMKEVQGKLKPERGQGHRYMTCERYDDCLALAATANWKTWRCSPACAFYDGQGKQKDTKPAEPKPPNSRVCSDCKERTTLSPNCPLCPQCMAKRSNAKAKVKKEPEPKGSEAGPEQKRATQSPNFGRSRPPEGSKYAFFGKGPCRLKWEPGCARIRWPLSADLHGSCQSGP